MPVYWGTDRAVQPNAKRLVFGSDRARKLQLGEALVTVPKVHEVPNVERPWVVKIPYFDVTLYAEKEDPKKHFTVKEIKALTKEELLAQVKARLGASKLFKDQAIVFVHGYNTSFDNALYRTAQIAYDLDFDGATFLYSWPSGGAVASYTYDRESAQASEPYLREFLEMVVKQTGAKSVSIIAHSMGNQPLMDVLRDMRIAAPEGVEISQVILAAPDVDADSFTNLAQDDQGSRQERDAVRRLQRPGADRVAQLLGQLSRRRRAAGRAADPARHRHDRRDGGLDRHVRHQPLGLCLEQQAARGHRRAVEDGAAAAGDAHPEAGQDQQPRAGDYWRYVPAPSVTALPARWPRSGRAEGIVYPALRDLPPSVDPRSAKRARAG